MYENLIGSKHLFDDLCSMQVLELGFEAVRKNKGAAGIDGTSVEKFEQNLKLELHQLQAELANWRYVPKPVRAVEIPKANGGKRLLGIPCVRDRVVQASVKLLLEPLLDWNFSENSYGFRPGRNQLQAVVAAEGFVKSGKSFVVDIDLEKFFDRIHHDRLISRLGLFVEDKRLLRLIGLTLRSGIMKQGIISSTPEGSVQGSPLSPLLSNVVLDELDKELEKRGLSFCRFADDCNIFVKSAKAAERVMTSVTKFIEERLKLKVNSDKSQVAPSQRVKFLGMTITECGVAAISVKSMDRAKEKIISMTRRGTNLSLEQSIAQINKWYIGWSNYYSMTRFPQQLTTLEARTRRRLRARIVYQHKRRSNLFKKLLARGVPRNSATKVFSNKGIWALSVTRAMHLAYNNKWFTKTLGLRAIGDEYRPHWFPTSKTPRL